MTNGNDVLSVPVQNVLCDPNTNKARWDSGIIQPGMTGLMPKSQVAVALVTSFGINGWKVTSEGIVEATLASELHQNPYFKDREAMVDRLVELRQELLAKLEINVAEVSTGKGGTEDQLSEAQAAIEVFNEFFRDPDTGEIMRPEGEIYWLADGHQRFDANFLGAVKRQAKTIKDLDEGVTVPLGLGDLMVVPIIAVGFKDEDERFMHQADANESKTRTAVVHTIADKLNISVTMLKRGKTRANLQGMFGTNPGAKFYCIGILCDHYTKADIFGRLVASDQNPGEYPDKADRLNWSKLSHKPPFPMLASSINQPMVDRWNAKQDAKRPEDRKFTEILDDDQILNTLLAISHADPKKGTLSAKQWEAGLISKNPILLRMADAHTKQNIDIFEELNAVSEEFAALDSIISTLGAGESVGLLESVRQVAAENLEFVTDSVNHLVHVPEGKREAVTKYLSKFN